MERKMSTFTRIAAAALLAVGFASAASAQEWTGHQIQMGNGEDRTFVYTTPNTNVVGGATYRFSGSGENVTAVPTQVQTMLAGRPHHQVGSGEGGRTVYFGPGG